MTILVDHEIVLAMTSPAIAEKDRLVIKPIYEPIQPASVDLRLGPWMIEPQGNHIIDPLMGLGTTDYERDLTRYELQPGGFVIVSTLEWIEIPPTLVGILVGKSSLARFGLQVECAGYVDPGWKGRLTLELKNLGHDIIILRREMLIAQIRFSPVARPKALYGNPILNSHYQGAQGPQAGRVDRLQEPSEGSSVAQILPER